MSLHFQNAALMESRVRASVVGPNRPFVSCALLIVRASAKSAISKNAFHRFDLNRSPGGWQCSSEQTESIAIAKRRLQKAVADSALDYLPANLDPIRRVAGSQCFVRPSARPPEERRYGLLLRRGGRAPGTADRQARSRLRLLGEDG